MFSPLMEQIIERENFRIVDENDYKDFCKEHDIAVIMVAGDYVRIGAVNDVAVILPELVKAYQGRFTPCIARRKSEAYFQATYKFVLLPTLVFFRDGLKIGAISGVLDWTDYLAQINAILAMPKQVMQNKENQTQI